MQKQIPCQIRDGQQRWIIKQTVGWGGRTFQKNENDMILNPKGPVWDLVIHTQLRCNFLPVTEWTRGLSKSTLPVKSPVPTDIGIHYPLHHPPSNYGQARTDYLIRGIYCDKKGRRELDGAFFGISGPFLFCSKQTKFCPFPALFEVRERTHLTVFYNCYHLQSGVKIPQIE